MTSTTTPSGRTRPVSLRPCSATVEIDAPRRTPALSAIRALVQQAGLRTSVGGNGTAAGAFCAVQIENAAFGAYGSGGCLRRPVVLDAATRMARAGGGRMVLITDALPWPAGSAHVDRSARQNADLHWWQQLAARVAPRGVRMNAIRLGYTPFVGHALPRAAEAVLYAHQVIRRPVSEADLQAALTLLLSQGSNAMVGEVLPLDGGLETGLVPVSASGTAKVDSSTVPPAQPWSLEGRTVLVTGASSGIGAETALELARRGADVVLAARRLPELEEVAAAIREHLGRRAWTVRADLASPGAGEALVDEALEQAGTVHDFVHAAGVLPRDDQPDARRLREEAYRINVFSMVDAVERLSPRWISTKHRGNIVAVSSTSAQTAPVPGLYSYGSGKAAVAQLSTHLAVTLARHRIRVNAVLPGIVRTPMTDTADPAFVTASLRRIPSGRLCEPEDVVAAVAYLVSPASAMVSGAQLRVCGGWATLRSLPAFGERAQPEHLLSRNA